MDDSLVIVIDPLNSSLRDEIFNYLDHLDYIRYLELSIDNINSSGTNPLPGLILILLDNCEFNEKIIRKLEEIPRLFPATPVVSIINTAYNYRDLLKCKQFSWSFIPVPVKADDIKILVSWFVKNNSGEKKESIEHILKQSSLMDLFIGESRASLRIKNKISQISQFDVTVLLQGETGTGKELTAKLIHYLSKRSQSPFIAVNCGTIPNELFENELFGHNKGAYTHAETTEIGMVHSANKGTLFLDEIESLPLSSQVKLLRFIEEKKYKPLGHTSYISTDLRIIAASNKDLAGLVAEGKFREDLFYRLAVVNISIPPLRERREDIRLLTNYFVDKFSKLYDKDVRGINPDAMLGLTYYDWPGNVREMENLIQEAVIFCKDNLLEIDHLNFKGKSNINIAVFKTFSQSKKQNVEEFEKKYLNTVLRLFNGNISKASEFANKNRREIYRLINKYNIMPNSYRTSK